MLRLSLALLVVCVHVFAAGTTDKVDTNASFEAGLVAYQHHDFPLARDHFRKAVEQGPVTARLLHNLALAYYQTGQRAFALAYWRKALAVDPSYPAALTGRELLEEHMHMRSFEKDGPSLRVRHAFERVSGFLVSWAFALLVTVFAWLLLRYLGERRAARDEERAGPGVPIAAITIGVSALVTASVLAIKLNYDMTARATVVAEQAGAKSLPNDESATLFTLPPGGEVLIKRNTEGWAQVQTSDGGTGWVKAADLVLTSEM